MATQTKLSPELLTYFTEISSREDVILRELREETTKYPMGTTMQVMAEEGQLLAFLVALTKARLVLEIGTFTGYSTLCMARALGPEGRLVTCDISEKWPMIGEPYWDKAGVRERIDVRIGDAQSTLTDLVCEWGPGTVDFAFIDADKANYHKYYESTLTLLRPGGLMLLDNTLLFGRVIDVDQQDPDTVAIRELNKFVHRDDRVELSMLTMADGITLVMKKENRDLRDLR